MKEARKLGIPVVAVVDTNCDPTVVDYVIPGNDDALRAIRLFTSKIADSAAEGVNLLGDKAFQEEVPEPVADGSSEISAEASSGDEVDLSFMYGAESAMARSSSPRWSNRMASASCCGLVPS